MIHRMKDWNQIKLEMKKLEKAKYDNYHLDDKDYKKAMSHVVDGKEVTEERNSCFKQSVGKIMSACDWPYVWLARLTCLPPQREEWAAWKFYAWPFTGVYFIISTMTVSFGSMTHLYYGVPCCVLLSVFMFYKLRNNGIEELKKTDQAPEDLKEMTKAVDSNKNDPNERLIVKESKAVENQDNGPAGEEEEVLEVCNRNLFNWVAVMVGIIAGLMWTYLLVGILIDMLNALGIFLNLDSTFLGLTILAVGNALPDALTTISIAGNPKKVTMAVSGGYAGQIFGLLIGFGLAQLKQTLTNGPQTFNLFDPAAIQDNLLDLLVLGVALICLLWTFFWGICNKFHMNKTFAYVGLGIYGAFFVACFIIAISKAIRTY